MHHKQNVSTFCLFITLALMKAITEQEKRFVEIYLTDFKSREAAIAAGYSVKSSSSIGSQLLTRPQVQEYMQMRQKQLATRADIQREKIIAELVKVAFSDPRKFFDEHGNLLEIPELDDVTAGAISSIEVEELYAGTGQNRLKIGVIKKLKQWDKLKAIDILNQMLGFYAPIKVDASSTFMEFLKQTSGQQQPRQIENR